MKISPQTWFVLSERLMPAARAEWLAAMKVELEQIDSSFNQKQFAFGCFKAAVKEFVRSRKGLSWIARLCGALFMFAGSAGAILLWSSRLSAEPEMYAIANLITALCLCYIGAAALLMISLRGLKIYASLGFGLAVLAWSYLQISNSNFEGLPMEFLLALSFEVAGIMAALFIMAIYLNWLYSPSLYDT